MRIFLNGGGDGTQTIEVNKRLNKVINHTKPLLYIPLAMESEKYPDCLEWIKGELKDIEITGIEMVTSAKEIVDKDLNQYCALFIGGGNTFKLLHTLKVSGAFEKIKAYIENDGIVFGGSAGVIIFGESLESCVLDDTNEVALKDISGFDVLNGISILCHYTNHEGKRDEENEDYLLELSKRRKVIALPEEDTLFVNGDKVELIGSRPYYVFQNGVVERWQNGFEYGGDGHMIQNENKTDANVADSFDKEKLEWEEIHTEHIVQDKWIDFRRSSYRFPDGNVFEPFYTYSRRDYVVVVASDKDGKYLCVRQFRQGIKEVTTEFPAGSIERTDRRECGSGCSLSVSEDALEAAKRELIEETGYVSDDWRYLLTVPSNATIADNYAYIFMAENCYKSGEQNLDETEFLNVRKYSADEIEEMIGKGNFQQAVHIMAWLLTQKKLKD